MTPSVARSKVQSALETVARSYGQSPSVIYATEPLPSTLTNGVIRHHVEHLIDPVEPSEFGVENQVVNIRIECIVSQGGQDRADKLANDIRNALPVSLRAEGITILRAPFDDVIPDLETIDIITMTLVLVGYYPLD